MSAELIEAALAWHDAGFCVLPASTTGNKAVGLSSWHRYQTDRPSREQVAVWAVQADGIGLLMGQVSGNAEMLEIEGKAQELVTPFLNAVAGVDAGLLLAKLMTYCEVTPSGGYHWIYRVEGDPVAGNTKLASRPAETANGRDTLLETRGQGGWVVVAPSGGRTHPTGRNWTSFDNARFGVVGTLTAAERETVHAIARSFDLMPVQAPIEHREARAVIEGELTPGQDFSQRHTWADLLEPLGWTFFRREGEKEIWTRPGKDRREGGSATVNYDGNDNLWIFSSSTGYPSEQSLTKFAFYAWTHHGGDFSSAARDLRGKGYGSAQAPRDTSEVQAEMRATLDLLPDDASAGVGVAVVTGEEGSSRTSFQLTDRGNAHLLAQVEHPRLRYAADRDCWLRWHNGRWEVQISDSAAVQAFIALVDAMDHTEKATYAHKIRSMSAGAIDKAVRLAKKNPLMEVSIADFDAAPDELNTPDGVVNLITGDVTPHTPDGLHTRMTSVAVDTELHAPRWNRFLADTFGSDVELIGFIQRLAGYSATGRVTHHVLPFLHGSGANGKSVFLEVLMRILGDYASTTPADFLLLGGREDEAAVARLSGLRLVVASEVGPSARFNEQKVKMLTGGDSLTARFLYQNHFTFSPTHKLWLMGNHQPRVDAGGDSFWRRLRLVPFAHTVPEERRIVDLAAQLVREEGPAILAWIIEGARRQVGGLKEPASVKAATSAYAEEEDHLGRFIEERIRFGGGEHVRLSTADVRHAYEQWCFAEGEKPIPANVFGRELKARGAGTAKSGSRRFYTNVTLMRADQVEERERPEQLIYGMTS
jgi:putative DNA primase/helicase